MSSTRRASGGLGYCQWPPLEPDDMSESLSRRWYIQTSGQSELCSLCGCTHLQFFILRDFSQCCTSFWRESLACPRLGRGSLHWQLSREGEAVFLNVAMLLWLAACTQVWRLGQVHESQPRSVPFPAHLLQLLSFRLTTSVLTNQSPWCPASCFQTPFNCSMVGGGDCRGADTSKLELTLEMFHFLCSFPSHIFQHHGSWQQPSP